MKHKTLPLFWMTICSLLFWGNIVAEELTISVKPGSKGPKGTMCDLVGNDGAPTGKKVIVRQFFAEAGRMGEVHHLKVTTEGETMEMRGPNGPQEMPIYHLVEESGANAPQPKQNSGGQIQSSPKTEVADKEKYWFIDGDAAILIPKGWSVTQGLAAPVQMAAESTKGGLGFSVLKEVPADINVSTVAEYAALKSQLMKGNFPDFQPSEPKAGKIGELPASFFQGPGTIENVNGEIICMAIQGKDHLYLLLGILGKGSNEASRTELMKVMRSFKEKA